MTILSTTDLLKAGMKAGDLASIPGQLNEYTASHIGIADDLQKLSLMNSGSAISFTIPSDADLAAQLGFGPSIGHHFQVVAFGAGTVTSAPASGVTLLNGASVDIAAQYNCVAAVRYSPNVWFAVGAIA